MKVKSGTGTTNHKVSATVHHPIALVGAIDLATTGLALTPNRYSAYPTTFPNDIDFTIGTSDPATAWSYIHPGPNDTWAGKRSHTFTLHFDLPQTPPNDLALTAWLIDTQQNTPPKLALSPQRTNRHHHPAPRRRRRRLPLGRRKRRQHPPHRHRLPPPRQPTPRRKQHHHHHHPNRLMARLRRHRHPRDAVAAFHRGGPRFQLINRDRTIDRESPCLQEKPSVECLVVVFWCPPVECWPRACGGWRSRQRLGSRAGCGFSRGGPRLCAPGQSVGGGGPGPVLLLPVGEQPVRHDQAAAGHQHEHALGDGLSEE